MRMEKTFAEMIEEALTFFQGRASQREICDYIERNYPEVSASLLSLSPCYYRLVLRL
jgi:hypothetical protein